MTSYCIITKVYQKFWTSMLEVMQRFWHVLLAAGRCFGWLSVERCQAHTDQQEGHKNQNKSDRSCIYNSYIFQIWLKWDRVSGVWQRTTMIIMQLFWPFNAPLPGPELTITKGHVGGRVVRATLRVFYWSDGYGYGITLPTGEKNVGLLAISDWAGAFTLVALEVWCLLTAVISCLVAACGSMVRCCEIGSSFSCRQMHFRWPPIEPQIRGRYW